MLTPTVDEIHEADRLFTDLCAWKGTSISRAKYNELRQILQDYTGVDLPCLRRYASRLTDMTNLNARLIDCCINSCVAYTGGYTDLNACPKCGYARWRMRQNGTHQPYQQYMYMPLADRLKYQYTCRQRARILQSYCHPFFDQPRGHAVLTDWWSGRRYRDLRHQGHFQETTDIALQLLLDGVQLVERGNHSSTPVILINYNLPPALRYQKHNIMVSLIIPGPKKYKDVDSFLYPLVEELKQLRTGITAYDAYRRRPFTLRAEAVLVTGDGPAIQEAMGMKTPGNAKAACRSCLIWAKKAPNGHFYVPHRARHLQPGGLPMRSNLRDQIHDAVDSGSAEIMKRLGMYSLLSMT